MLFISLTGTFINRKICNSSSLFVYMQVRNKIVNDKEIFKHFSINNDTVVSPNMQVCECNNSKFCDDQYVYIVTEELRLFKFLN